MESVSAAASDIQSKKPEPAPSRESLQGSNSPVLEFPAVVTDDGTRHAGSKGHPSTDILAEVCVTCHHPLSSPCPNDKPRARPTTTVAPDLGGTDNDSDTLADESHPRPHPSSRTPLLTCDLCRSQMHRDCRGPTSPHYNLTVEGKRDDVTLGLRSANWAVSCGPCEYLVRFQSGQVINDEHPSSDDITWGEGLFEFSDVFAAYCLSK